MQSIENVADGSAEKSYQKERLNLSRDKKKNGKGWVASSSWSFASSIVYC